MKERKLYRSIFLAVIFCCLILYGCGKPASGEIPSEKNAQTLENPAPVGQMTLSYATQFAVDYYAMDYKLVSIRDGLQYLLVPEGAAVPTEDMIRQMVEHAVAFQAAEGGIGDAESPENTASENTVSGAYIPPTIIQLPVHGIYQAASSAMDLLRQIRALDMVKLTGTRLSDWTIPEIHDLVENGTIAYGGKYNAPDYELILTKGCDLAIESTMIYHNPEAKEKLEELGIPVLVERSSYETHPLGRAEWIRLYGLLCGREEEAENFMADCQRRLEAITASDSSNSGHQNQSGQPDQLGQPESSDQPKVAFFYISSNGTANVRKPGDYISRMIQMAGGDYIYGDLPADENALSTMNLQMETFYEKTVDADILIYNSTVGEEIHTMQELLDKEPLLAGFKAVKKGRVWCTGQNMYQETTGAVGMIEDFHAVLQGDEGAELTYLHHIDN